MTAATLPHRRGLLALGVVGVTALVGAIVTQPHLRINTTDSMPLGVWWVEIGHAPQRGDYVTFCLAGVAGTLARERGYVGDGSCPNGSVPLLKPVVAVSGDVVTVSEAGLSVNGASLPDTQARPLDSIGRPMTRMALGDYRVEPGTVWVASGHNPRSYDSRYFGAINLSEVQATARPVLVK